MMYKLRLLLLLAISNQFVFATNDDDVDSFEEVSLCDYIDAVNSKHYYSVLGISPMANQDEIKKRCRRLSLLCHPDKSANENATEIMKKINGACAVLQDAEARAEYDLTSIEKRRVAGWGDWAKQTAVWAKQKVGL